MLVAVIAVFLVVLYGLFDPAQTGYFPKCPFRWATGLQCPGCGSQRAIHQLLHGKLKAAFQYNPLLVCSLPLLAFLFSADVFRFRYPKLYVASRNPFLSWSILTVILLWWVLRNIFGW